MNMLFSGSFGFWHMTNIQADNKSDSQNKQGSKFCTPNPVKLWTTSDALLDPALPATGRALTVYRTATNRAPRS